MINLKNALKEGKIKEFIKDHPASGDQDKFKSTISSMVCGKKKEAPAASSPVSCESCDDIQIRRRKKKDV